MLIAFNDDIEFHSRWYHIQTEDNGIRNGHITTTVFHSGQILDSKSISYLDALEGVQDPEEQNKIIKELMTKQHQQFYAKLQEGSYDSLMQQLRTRANTSQVGLRILSNSGGGQSSRPSSQVSSVGSAFGQNSGLGTSQRDPMQKPETIRSSQSPNPGMSRLGLKPMSGVSNKLPSTQGISPAHVGSPLANKSDFSSSQNLSPVYTSSPSSNASGQPSVQQLRRVTNRLDSNVVSRMLYPTIPILVSQAVESERMRRAQNAWTGVCWPSDDLAVDTLVLSLLEQM